MASTVREVTLPTTGKVKLYVQGTFEENRNKAVFLTCHDIGSNHRSFFPFVDHESMSDVSENSIFIHLCLPGHGDGAPNLDNYEYPSLDVIGQEMVAVLNEFNLRTVVGIGEGAGANIMCRFALAYPEKCLGLVLIHCTSATAGVVEYVKEKWIEYQMNSYNLVTDYAMDFLVGHKFGAKYNAESDVVKIYTADLQQRLNAHNLTLYIDAFLKRTSLASELPKLKKDTLLVVGANVDDRDAVEYMHSLMNKETTTLLVLDNIGNPMLEAPQKFAKDFILFGKQCGVLGAVPVPGFELPSKSKMHDV